MIWLRVIVAVYLLGPLVVWGGSGLLAGVPPETMLIALAGGAVDQAADWLGTLLSRPILAITQLALGTVLWWFVFGSPGVRA